MELFNVEPFQYYVNPVDFWVEIVFYAMIGYFLLLEVLEIWDCTGWAPPLDPSPYQTDFKIWIYFYV